MIGQLTKFNPPKQVSLLDLEEKLLSKEKPVQKGEGTPDESHIETPVQKAKDPWTTLKKRLNNYRTRAPLFAMAMQDDKTSVEDVFKKAEALNNFHRETALHIANRLWPGDQKVPDAALAVVGKGISDTMGFVWGRNTSSGEPITSKQVADLYLRHMPEIDLQTEDIFADAEHIPLSVLSEASLGAKIASKLIETVGSQPEAVQRLFLNNEDIESLTSKMTNEAIKAAKVVSSGITVHKKLTIQDDRLQEIAYQSTLKTFSTLYEASISNAVGQIKNTLAMFKSKSQQEKMQYLESLKKHEQGQLFDNVLGKVEKLVSAVYMLKPEPKAKPADNYSHAPSR